MRGGGEMKVNEKELYEKQLCAECGALVSVKWFEGHMYTVCVLCKIKQEVEE